MVLFFFEILLIAMLVSIACAIPGVFLVLKRLSLMSDAVSHAILFGIVIVFAIVNDLNSPLMIAGAALTGVLTAFLVDILQKSQLVKEDAAIGIVFPLLFSLGVLLITRNFSNIHLDVDAVLLGELAFAPFERLTISGIDIGAKAIYSMGTIAGLNIILLVLFYKELKISTFDSALSSAAGFSPVIINYGLMIMVSLTSVTAFNSVGSILVIAFMIAPAASAYLMSDNLVVIIILAVIFGIISAVCGFFLAYITDTNIAGAMASVTGIVFLFSFLLAPSRGIISRIHRNSAQKKEFACIMVLIHVLNHAGSSEFIDECDSRNIYKHLGWEKDFAEQIIKTILRKKYAYKQDNALILFPAGEALAKDTMTLGRTDRTQLLY
mgnify:CR=1 FL=1